MNHTVSNLAFNYQVTDSEIKLKSDKIKLNYTESIIQQTNYSFYLRNLSYNYFIEMTSKQFITNFFKNLKSIYPQINSVYYYKEGKIISLYTFISIDDIELKKTLINETIKLYNNFHQYLFDFMIYPLKYINNYNNSPMEKII